MASDVKNLSSDKRYELIGWLINEIKLQKYSYQTTQIYTHVASTNINELAKLL